MFGDRLATDAVLRGVINAIPSPVATQAIAAAGADFVLIDGEHGPIGPESMHAMIAATAGSGCAPLVRVPEIAETPVKTALDAGAEGIFFPLVRSVADAERCVSLTRYPPEGTRGWGPFAAAARHNVALADYASTIRPACVVMLETAEAVENADAIAAVPGIDLLFVAQFDLGMAVGAEQLEAAVAVLEAAAGRAGVPLGGPALTPERSRELLARGYRLVITGIDLLALSDAVRAYST